MASTTQLFSPNNDVNASSRAVKRKPSRLKFTNPKLKKKSHTVLIFNEKRAPLDSVVKQTVIPISKLGLFHFQILDPLINDPDSPIVIISKYFRQHRFATIHFGELIFVFHSVRINRFTSICNRLLVISKFLAFGFCISVRVSFFAFFRGNPVKWNIIGYFIAVAKNKMFVRFLRSGSVNVVTGKTRLKELRSLTTRIMWYKMMQNDWKWN